jgi:hypothetical protein
VVRPDFRVYSVRPIPMMAQLTMHPFPNPVALYDSGLSPVKAR